MKIGKKQTLYVQVRMKNIVSKIVKMTGAVLFAAACLFSLLQPLPGKISNNERYECIWSDGSVSEESYSSAYQSFAGMDEEYVLLSRGGLTGRIKSMASGVFSVLESGNLGELLSCKYEGSRLDGAALFRTFSKRVWYSGAYFVWTGSAVERVSGVSGEEVVLLSGTLSSRVLKETNASTVYLRANAKIRADAFAGSRVTQVRVEEPYSTKDGAIYIDTEGGKRLITALPGIDELSIHEDLVFADEGALLYCQNLTSLTLPFLGSAVSPSGIEYAGELAHLFANGAEYLVPETLTRLCVMGGTIGAYAFWACSHVKEINVCKVDPNEMSEQAFLGLDCLESLHTPKSDVLLEGEFTCSVAECGCTIFERIHAQN